MKRALIGRIKQRLGPHFHRGHVPSHVATIQADECDREVSVTSGLHTETAIGPWDRPRHRDGSLCRKGPICGIADWTGPVYDTAQNHVGQVSECGCYWVRIGHESPLESPESERGNED